MMMQPVVSRTQRRIERKQLLLIVVLILAVAAGSFALGVMFGQRGVALPVRAVETDQPSVPTVTQVVPPPLPPVVDTAEHHDKLTFYENLPKGNQAPLGSGINLPPEEPKATPVSKPPELSKVKPAPPTPALKTVAVPVPAAKGAFVVQIASFRSGEEASRLADRLQSYQLATYVESADLGAKGVWYRVLAGPYASREDAERAAGQLHEKERLTTLVRQR